MGSVEDIGRMDLVQDKPPREEKNKEDRENKQSQMSLSLKVNFTLLLLDNRHTEHFTCLNILRNVFLKNDEIRNLHKINKPYKSNYIPLYDLIFQPPPPHQLNQSC